MNIITERKFLYSLFNTIMNLKKKNEVYKMGTRADTMSSNAKLREVFSTLEHILDVIPNTRGNTPIEEFESRKEEFESLLKDVSNLNLNIDESEHNEYKKHFKGGKRNYKRRSVK